MSDSQSESSLFSSSSLSISEHNSILVAQNLNNVEFQQNYFQNPNINFWNPTVSNNYYMPQILEVPSTKDTEKLQVPLYPLNTGIEKPNGFTVPSAYDNQELQHVQASYNFMNTNINSYKTVYPAPVEKKFVPKVKQNIKVYEDEQFSNSILISNESVINYSIIIEKNEPSQIKKAENIHIKSFLDIFPYLKFKKTIKEFIVCKKFSPLEKLSRIKVNDVNFDERAKGIKILKNFYSELDEKSLERCSILDIYMLASLNEHSEVICFFRNEPKFVEEMSNFTGKSLVIFDKYAAKYHGDSIISFLFTSIREFIIEKFRTSKYSLTESCLEEYLENHGEHTSIVNS